MWKKMHQIAFLLTCFCKKYHQRKKDEKFHNSVISFAVYVNIYKNVIHTVYRIVSKMRRHYTLFLDTFISLKEIHTFKMINSEEIILFVTLLIWAYVTNEETAHLCLNRDLPSIA